MERIAIRLDPAQPYQAQTITIQPDGRTVTLRVEFRYLPYIGKWFMSVWDASNSSNLLMYIPIVSSEEVINDLLGLFNYMNIGSCACFPVSIQQYGTDPGETTLGLFEIQWGDQLG